MASYQPIPVGDDYSYGATQDNTITQNTASGSHVAQNAAGNDSLAAQAVHNSGSDYTHYNADTSGGDGRYYQSEHYASHDGQDNAITQNAASGHSIAQNAAGHGSDAAQWVHQSGGEGHFYDGGEESSMYRDELSGGGLHHHHTQEHYTSDGGMSQHLGGDKGTYEHHSASGSGNDGHHIDMSHLTSAHHAAGGAF
ncbi:hypothetical protein RI367_003835 [Sorochytrium milnesiophthora]